MENTEKLKIQTAIVYIVANVRIWGKHISDSIYIETIKTKHDT